MQDKMLLYTAIGMVVVAVVVSSILFMRSDAKAKPVKEDFAGMGVSFTTKTVPEIRNNQGYFFSVPPNLEAALSPRISGTATYGPWLNTEMAQRQFQGVPINPLTQKNTIKSCNNGANVFNSDDMRMNGNSSYAENFQNVAPNFSSGNYQDMEDTLERTPISSSVPQFSSTAMATDGSETIAQPIVYDRYIYANQKSRLAGLGDPIRGDLPIVPYNGDWFRPSVQPNIDLREGAMMVLAGENNATARQTMALMNQSSGNTMNTFAGAPIMASQRRVGFGAGGADVYATAFP